MPRRNRGRGNKPKHNKGGNPKQRRQSNFAKDLEELSTETVTRPPGWVSPYSSKKPKGKSKNRRNVKNAQQIKELAIQCFGGSFYRHASAEHVDPERSVA